MTTVRLANLFGATALALSDRIRQATSTLLGIGGEAPAALLTVGTRPGHSIEHLRRSLGLSHSGAVRLVDRLEGSGWVERRRSEGAREVALWLTGSGEDLHRSLLQARRRVIQEALEPLAPDTGGRLEEALETVLAGLPEDRDAAWHICRLCEHGVCRGSDCPVGHAVDEASSA